MLPDFNTYVSVIINTGARKIQWHKHKDQWHKIKNTNRLMHTLSIGFQNEGAVVQ